MKVKNGKNNSESQLDDQKNHPAQGCAYVKKKIVSWLLRVDHKIEIHEKWNALLAYNVSV